MPIGQGLRRSNPWKSYELEKKSASRGEPGAASALGDSTAADDGDPANGARRWAKQRQQGGERKRKQSAARSWAKKGVEKRNRKRRRAEQND